MFAAGVNIQFSGDEAKIIAAALSQVAHESGQPQFFSDQKSYLVSDDVTLIMIDNRGRAWQFKYDSFERVMTRTNGGT